MEGGEGDDRIELGDRRLPRLELRVHDLDSRERRQVRPGEPGESLPQLDARDPEATPRERQRRLSRPAADLDDPRAFRKLGQRGEVVEDLFRVGRTRPVVELRDFLESRSLPIHAD